MIVELPNNHIGVKLPEDAHSAEIVENPIDGGYLIYMPGLSDSDCEYMSLPYGHSYTLLFTTKDKVTEEMAGEVVERVSGWEKPLYYDYCASGRDYRDIVDAAFKEALPSYNSLLRSLDMTGNWAVLKIK